VPAGVVCVGVKDPTWTGRRTVAVTAARPADAARAVVVALRAAAAEEIRRGPAASDHGA